MRAAIFKTTGAPLEIVELPDPVGRPRRDRRAGARLRNLRLGFTRLGGE